MQNDIIGKKIHTKIEENFFMSTRDNSTDPPLMTWDQDKKNIFDFQNKDLVKRSKLNKKNIKKENAS